MNSTVICITIIICVYIIGYFVNEIYSKIIDKNKTIVTMTNDLSVIKNIVTKYMVNDSNLKIIKDNIATIKNIVYKYE